MHIFGIDVAFNTNSDNDISKLNFREGESFSTWFTDIELQMYSIWHWHCDVDIE